MAARKAPATVSRYVSSVATFHRAAGVANPCDALAIKLALKRMHRELGRDRDHIACRRSGAVRPIMNSFLTTSDQIVGALRHGPPVADHLRLST